MSGRISQFVNSQTCYGKIFYWTTLLIFLYCIFLGVIYMPSNSSNGTLFNRVHILPEYQASFSDKGGIEGNQSMTLEENVLGDKILSGRGTKFERKRLSEKNHPGFKRYHTAASSKTMDTQRRNTQPFKHHDSDVTTVHRGSEKAQDRNTQKTLPGLVQQNSRNDKAILSTTSENMLAENNQKAVSKKHLSGESKKIIRQTPASNIISGGGKKNIRQTPASNIVSGGGKKRQTLASNIVSGSGNQRVKPVKKIGMTRKNNTLTAVSDNEMNNKVTRKNNAASRPSFKSPYTDSQKLPVGSFPPRPSRESLLRDVTYKTLMKTPRPKFLKDYKAPCLRMIGSKAGSEQSANESNIACLPAVYLAGQPKCGSTDLYEILSMHHQIIRTTKEPQYWSRNRFYKRKEKMETYLNIYKNASHNIQSNCVETDSNRCIHKNIFLDASVSLLWDNDKWPVLPENAQQEAPRVLNAHHIHHLTPKAKFIVLLRDPVRRQYSSYTYFSRTSTSVQDFHEKVVKTVKLFEDCAKEFGVRSCAYNGTLRRATPLRLHPSLYSIYISDWLKVFPRDQFYFLRLEDYMQSRLKYVLDIIFNFLGLDEPPSWFYNVDRRTKVANQQTNKPKLDMLPETFKEFFCTV